MRPLRPLLCWRPLAPRAFPKPRAVTALPRLSSRPCSRCVPLADQARPASAANDLQPSVDATNATASQHHDLYTTSLYSPGSPLFHPNGAYIFNKLISFIRAQYPTYGFQEVLTPTIYKRSLWQVSGHWENYSDDMFEVRGRGFTGTKADAEKGEDEEFGLKPMNCPGHCLLFASEKRSYRDLPIRFADFSALHRNEISGALTGLTRVRRFHQDDGHIFCRPSQILSEIKKSLQFVDMVYNTFGLGPYKLVLSTRPEDHYIGTIEEWDLAESQLKTALDESGQNWTISPHDGAFYGPKIDIILQDPINVNKQHQLATIQLDFQLPQRFELSYTSPTSDAEGSATTSDPTSASSPAGTETPVLIHRAILGSIERFMALLLSHSPNYTLPFWINPQPLVILPIKTTPALLQYCEDLRSYLSGETSDVPTVNSSENSNVNSATKTKPTALNALHLPIAIDTSARSLGKKKMEAIKNGYAFIAVVGEQEMKSGSLTLEMLRCAERTEGHVRELLLEAGGADTTAAKSGEAKKKGKSGSAVSLEVGKAKDFLRRLVERYL